MFRLLDKIHNPFKSIVLTICIVISIASNGNCQPIKCGTDEYYRGLSFTNTLNKKNIQLESRSPIILPVVVHIVWNKPEENLSELAIQHQMERLNIDFNNSLINNRGVPKEFAKLIGNPSFRFCLATKGPDGKKSSGIIRVKTSNETIGSQKDNADKFFINHSSLGGSDAWDPEHYINIWVGNLENIFGRSSIGGMVKSKDEDGIVIDPDAFIADPDKNLLGRTLVHEMGHYLGLKHLWGQKIGDCDEDDGLADTPAQLGPYFGCPSSPQKSCGNNNMFMNFMDFVDDRCMYFFSKDQATLMNSILKNERPGLLTNSDLCTLDVETPMLNTIIARNSHNNLLIESKSTLSEPITYLIASISGQKMVSGEIFILPKYEITIKDWPTGIYFLYFRYNKEHRVIKFLKT